MKESIKNNRPNIILILADDMGYSDIGCYGSEIKTPNLDNLGQNGIRFTQAYNCARCCPSRASLLTGLYPHQAGIGWMVYIDHNNNYTDHLGNNCVTIGEVLGPSGYHTMMSGKWHVGHNKRQFPSDRGFMEYFGIHKHVDSYFKVLKGCEVYKDGIMEIPETDNPGNYVNSDKEWYSTDIFTEKALSFIDNCVGNNEPFFLYVPYNAPHWPLEAPEENIENFKRSFLRGWDELRQERLERMKGEKILPEETILSPTSNNSWEVLPSEYKDELDFRRAMYAAQIERLDENIGKIVERLKKNLILENTLIIFLSDNGCSAEDGMFGYNWGKYNMKNYIRWRKESGRSVSQGQAWACLSNTPFRLYKSWVHEGGIATPCIINWPTKIKSPGIVHSPVHFIDLMATLLDISGARYPKQFNGRKIIPYEGESFLKLLEGREWERQKPIFWEHEGNSAVRDSQLKLVRKYPGDWELYDMEKDRTEINDLSGKYPGEVKRLKEYYEKEAERIGVQPWPIDNSIPGCYLAEKIQADKL